MSTANFPIQVRTCHLIFFNRQVFWLLLLLPYIGQAQPQLLFNQITEEEGLDNLFNAFISKDSKGYIWISSSADGLLRFNGKTIKSYRTDELNPTSISSNMISGPCIEGQDQNLWFSTYNAINCYVRKYDRFQSYSIRDTLGNVLRQSYYVFHLDKNNNLWVQVGETGSGGLYLFNIDTQESTFMHKMDGQRCSVLTDKEGKVRRVISAMKAPDGGASIFDYDDQGTLIKEEEFFEMGVGKDTVFTFGAFAQKNEISWIATRKGLLKVEHSSSPKSTQTLFDKFRNQPLGGIWSVIEIEEQYLLVSSSYWGILLFNLENETFEKRYAHQEGDEFSLSSNNVKELYLDKDDNLWSSLYGTGVNYANLRKSKFDTPDLAGIARSDFDVTGLAEDINQRVWIATKAGKLFYIEGDGKTIQPYLTANKEFINNQGTAYLFGGDGKRIWVSKNKELFYLENNEMKRAFIFSTMIKYLIELNSGKILVSTLGENYELKKNSTGYDIEPLRGLKSKGGSFLQRAIQGDDDRIYASIGNRNLEIYEEQADSLVQREQLSAPTSFSEGFKEIDGPYLWLNSSDGFGRLNTIDYSFELVDDEAAKGTFFGLLNKDKRDFWLSNRKGLYKYNLIDGKIKTFQPSDGLITGGFNRFAYLKRSNGEMWFGGPNGINFFHPDSVKLLDILPQIELLAFQVNEKDYQPKDSIAISELTSFDMAPGQNSLYFEFIGMEYSDPAAITYRYMLEGVDPDWIESGTMNTARYPKVAHGTYTFRIQAANSDGLWLGSRDFEITIRPWFYQTAWFKALMLLLAVVITWLIYRDQLNRRLKKAEIKNLEELDQFKSRFFTSITHEFRTPLSIIKGNIDTAISQGKEISGAKLKLVQTHTSQLMDLINQILDLRKVESAEIKLQYTQSDVVDFCQKMIDGFSTLALAKNIQLTFTATESTYLTYIDEEKLQKILRNLLSNAIKFTPDGGEVQLDLNINEAEIIYKVTDNGLGILAEKLPHVFEQFYQAHEKSNAQVGSGIGLALSKELAMALKGDISVESQLGKGSVFTVRLPNHTTIPSEMALEESISLQLRPVDEAGSTELGSISDNGLAATLLKEAQEDQVGKPVILVVEDNLAFQQFISEILAPHFRLEMTDNGEKGFARANTLIPDIIISDVRMPVMDGFEMTKKLKNNYATSHIPVILLTGLDDKDSKLKGIAGGADVYLNKPFNKEELLLWIHNLLNLRERLQEVYSSSEPELIAIKRSNKIPDDPNREFIKEATRILEENYNEESFSIKKMSELMHMHYLTFHRKFKALTGENASKVLQGMRINEAKKLIIASPHIQIKEVAYAVGFSDPKHFSKTFKILCGKNPGEFKTDTFKNK